MPPDSAVLVTVVEDDDASPGDLRVALTRLLRVDARLGARTALGVLSRAPRIKPSTGLLVDPGDTVMRRWRRRVAAAQVLLAFPVAAHVFDELYDELTECRDFAVDVLTGVDPHPALSEPCRRALAHLVAEPGARNRS